MLIFPRSEHFIMTKTILLTIILAFTLEAEQTPSPTPNPQPQPATASSTQNAPGWFERLYRLIWPAGRYNGNPGEAASRSTEKSNDVNGISRLYVVDAESGAYEEWRPARGSMDFAISPDGTQLFFRRGKALFRQTIVVSATSTTAASQPAQLPNIEIGRLYACTRSIDGQIELWVADLRGVIRLIRLSAAAAPSWFDYSPPEGVSESSAKTAEELQLLRSLRPDGFQLWIRDSRLVGKRNETSDEFIIVKGGNRPRFYGAPLWINESSNFFFSSALTVE